VDYDSYECWNVGPIKVPFSSVGMHIVTESGYKLQIGVYTIPSDPQNEVNSLKHTTFDYKTKTYGSFLIQYGECKSNLGYIKLRSKNHFDTPIICEGLDNDENATALTEGVLFVRTLMNEQNQWKPVEVTPGNNLNFEEIKKYFKEESSFGHHICGTCAMGKVVDSELRVYNSKRLRVIDASIFPTNVTSNPSLPIYMVAEKVVKIIIMEYS
jgi:hypothetical protein